MSNISSIVLTDLYLRYPEGNSRMMLNLLDSHDTERFYNMVKPDIDIYLMAVLNLIAYPGWAMIYYGDEIFMEGAAPTQTIGVGWNGIRSSFILKNMNC
jgi:glycosidase